jgi:hypothetical protein
MPMSPQNAVLIVLIVCALGWIAGYALGGQSRTRSYQNSGEALVARAAMKHFSSSDYHLLNHITFQLRDGTTQVDHILVSRFGVFVIETKDYKGWIFASERAATWTQVLFKLKFRFQNPIIQNLNHVRAVQDQLDFLPRESVRSIVVFVGDAEFKTKVPSGVYDLAGFINHVRSYRHEEMSLNRMHFCIGRLEATRLAVSRRTDVEHIQLLQRRFGKSD